MWPINNDKGVHYDNVKYLSVERYPNKPQNILNNSVIVKQVCLVDTSLEMPTKCNNKRIDDAEVKCLSIKSNVEKLQNISEICLTVRQLRCQTDASPKGSENCNLYQQEKTPGLNYSIRCNLSQLLISNELPAINNMNKTIQPNLNILCDNSRSHEYKTYKMSSQPLDKNQSRSKRPSINKLERICEDVQRCRRPRWSETNIGDRQHPNRKNLKGRNQKSVVPCLYEPDYYDDEADILNRKHHRKTPNMQKENYKQNVGMVTWQQSCLDFRSCMDDALLLDGELACNNLRELKARSEEWSRQRVDRSQRQKEQQPRYEERLPRLNECPQLQEERKLRNKQWSPRQKERQQFLDERRLINVQQTDDELAKVEIQRFHLLKCIKRHQRILAMETQQLLKNQYSHRRLKTNNENEKLRLMMHSKCSLGEEQEQDPKQQCQVWKQYDSDEESLISRREPQRCRRMHQIISSSAYYNTDMKEQQRRSLTNILCTAAGWQMQVKSKRNTRSVSSPQLNIDNINELNDSQSLTALNNAWFPRETVDVTTLPPKQFNCDCAIEQLNEKEKRNVGSRPVANSKNDDGFRQSRSRPNKSRTTKKNNATRCVSQPLVSPYCSQLQRSQSESETCSTGPKKCKSSVTKYD